MTAGTLIAILAILIPLWILLRRDFVKGLAFAIFIWVAMTTFLRIPLPGSLPALTIHRLMLVEVTVAWLARGRLADVPSVPLFGCFVFWFLANLVSLAGTHIAFGTSLKTFLDSSLEILVFYLVVSTTLRTRKDAVRVLCAAWIGLLVVAIIAVGERYAGFNPVDYFYPGYRGENGPRMILSTYQHRILLGTAMVMGVPLSFVLRHEFENVGKKLRFFWFGFGLLFAASYYAQSRGPWVGLGLALMIMFALCAHRLRKNLVWIGLLAALMLLARPGVFDTLAHYAQDTVDTGSFKGGTAQYRLELWRVAYHEIAKSPWSFLFGYGPSAGTEIQVEWELSYRSEHYEINSWDNQFAYTLFQYGFVGLVATLLLYLKGLAVLFRAWRQSGFPDRNVLGCLLATAAVLIWMMTNVLVFAKQIDYLFWTVIAAGLFIAQEVTSLEQAPAGDGAGAVISEQAATGLSSDPDVLQPGY